MERDLRVKMGATIKLREFESARLDIEVADDLRPEDENDIGKGLDRLINIVDERLGNKVSELKG